MTCINCLKTVELALKEAGFTGKANLENREVVYYGKGTIEELSKVKDAILKEGYKPT
ncbi:copper resistance protein CopZ [Leptospira kirschneri]|uniref:copper resistance protein CopZ n=1 Tax=Leptospira kirschneri TaxID=29507 RepID=UPI0035626C6B